jgi:hypothetical protein
VSGNRYPVVDGMALRLRASLVAAGLLVVFNASCHAEAMGPPPCEGRYPQQQKIDLSQVLTKSDAISNVWGRANIQLIADPRAANALWLRIAYPQGSINPGADKTPVGGAGFKFSLKQRVTDACLTYQVRFPPEFEFVKGGKLPGLFGGDAPRGCAIAGGKAGFSARLMWRPEGAGELYLYHPGQSATCGESIDRGAWTFTRANWITIAEQVVMNAPGQSDGTIRVWIDGQLKIEARNLMLRDTADITVDGLLFSTFFGGNDPSWASPKDQAAEFKDFSLLF